MLTENRQLRSQIIRNAVYKKGKGKCWYCNVTLTTTGKNTKNDFCVDHLVPKSKGGELLNLDNMVASCFSCNTKKKNKTIDEYITYLGERSLLTPTLISHYGGYKTHKKYGSKHYQKMAMKRHHPEEYAKKFGNKTTKK